MVNRKNKSIFPTKQHTNEVTLTPPKPSMIAETANTVVQGMAFGTGSALGHRAVAAIFDNKDNKYESSTCTTFFNEFHECIKGKNIEECSHLLHKYKDCSNTSQNT
jgi:hypothetical protein